MTQYNALFESVRSRRRRPENPKGLDLFAAHAAMKVRNRRVTLSWLRRQAEQTDALAKEMRATSDAALDELVERCRERFVRGAPGLEWERRSLAVVREVARRVTGEEAYVVQLMGALALYHNRIIEMVTGEGKTLTGSIVAPMLAWRHKHVHIFTVNDYLASRDAESRRAIYRRCMCDVGAVVQEMDESSRYGVYAKPIVYGTPKQITADYLRDQIRLGQLNSAWAGRRLIARSAGGATPHAASGPMVPGLHAALVDEADAVLIDEGVVPLIIARARQEDEMSRIYGDAARLAERLDADADFKIEAANRRAELTRRGRHRLGAMFAELEEPIWRAARRAEELVRQALVARHCYLRGHQYEIVDGRVVIVDEYTGRFLPDRSWEHGLHQAVEAKEGLDVTADRETLARISFQRFFRMYPVLCGMTGTAADAALEMERVYQRPVTVIPTNRPVIRERWGVRVFSGQQAKWDAIVDSIEKIHGQGRPILVGTRSIEASVFLAGRLSGRGLAHRVLNASFDKDEAEIVSSAGRHGMITVATNMAGRGTDIKLDREAREAGGLHVLLTEMHTAKRIDRQFIGRAGRQGDPGSSQVFAALDDELVMHYAAGAASAIRAAAGGGEEGVELGGLGRRQGAMVLRLAQRRAEAKARRNRAEVLKQDDWIEKHLPGS
ncbi:MAG: hypothetical protein KF768_02240 [Phycisphaeraceae bacterium]|nr:hypothetical protein [Phycisphaeraceae bacterium]